MEWIKILDPSTLKLRQHYDPQAPSGCAVGARRKTGSNLASITAEAVREYGDAKLIRNNQNRRRRGGNGPRPQQMNGGNNYGNRLDNRQRGNASQLLEKYRPWHAMPSRPVTG